MGGGPKGRPRLGGKGGRRKAERQKGGVKAFWKASLYMQARTYSSQQMVLLMMLIIVCVLLTVGVCLSPLSS